MINGWTEKGSGVMRNPEGKTQFYMDFERRVFTCSIFRINTGERIQRRTFIGETPAKCRDKARRELPR